MADLTKIHFIERRIESIREMLLSAYKAGDHMSSASKGREREIFVDAFLSNVFPPAYRFGSGEVVDWIGEKSGQLDIVIEYPFFPSIPTFSESPRLYLADGVAAVIEVKSDVAGQWTEVESTAQKLSCLRRSPGVTVLGNTLRSPEGNHSSLYNRRIPLFAVGYTGWKTVESLIKHVDEGHVDGILVIDANLFVGGRDFRENVTEKAAALWSLIASIYLATTSAVISTADPLKYFRYQISSRRGET